MGSTDTIFKLLACIVIGLAVSGIEESETPIYSDNSASTTSSTIFADQPTSVLFMQGEAITDIDGNNYPSVIIGKQKWMTENLKTTHFQDGTPIDYPDRDFTSWQNNNQGACAWYHHDEEKFGEKYEALYNWFAVNNEAGLCPVGWRVPADEDWQELEVFLGMNVIEAGSAGWRGEGLAGKLKSTHNSTDEHPRWTGLNDAATNESRFSALPGGSLSSTGFFINIERYGYWWSATELSEEIAWSRKLQYDYSEITRFALNKNLGFSVRCIGK